MPDDAGIGQVPASEAIAASELTRLGCDQATSTLATTIAPTRLSSSNCGVSCAMSVVTVARLLAISPSGVECAE